VEFRLFGKHIAGTPSEARPIRPDRYALAAYQQGQTTYTKRVPAGILKPDQAIARVEAAGWQLQFREEVQRSSGRYTMLTFRRAVS
jgi:hypothetical protein